MKRICIVATGDRNADWQTWRQVVKNALTSDDLKGMEGVLIHGDARGIDYVAGKVAGMHGWSVVPVPALWKDQSYQAGPIRNTTMLQIASHLEDHEYEVRVYAFHEDFWKSKGTKNCVMQAQKYGFPVTLFMTDGRTADLSEEE